MGLSSGILTHASVDRGEAGKSAKQAVVGPCLLPRKIGVMTTEGQVSGLSLHALNDSV